MAYIPGDLRNYCIIFLGEFHKALLEGGRWNEKLFYF